MGVTEGLRRKDASGSGGSEAPGLKLKLGRAVVCPWSVERLKGLVEFSMADIGLLPVVLGKGEGAGVGCSGCAGKTK